uniref:procollagen-proline 4-dioxygenase n=1 Tax=Glossina brevipalpis TaxID=37001 RepID=A0A1A9WAC1_9MUSC
MTTLTEFQYDLTTENDLKAASHGLLRIQHIYDLNIRDLTNGYLNGKQYNSHLSYADLYVVALYLYRENLYAEAELWLKFCLENYNNRAYELEMFGYGKAEILNLYAKILRNQNKAEDAFIAMNEAIDLKPMDGRFLNTENTLRKLLRNQNFSHHQHSKDDDSSAYILACHGVFSRKPSKLHCLYNTITSPFLRLAPLKMELLNLDPYMVLYHDVLTDSEIIELKELAVEVGMVPSRTYNSTGGVPQYGDSNHRTSKVAWLKDDVNDITARLTERLADMTGLNVINSEPFQCANYGLGGEFKLHSDVIQHPNVLKKLGNRIVTALFYMNDVEQGGATVFPALGKSIFPNKGKALVWYNLDNEMKHDERAEHAGCPVLVGSKWGRSMDSIRDFI